MLSIEHFPMCSYHFTYIILLASLQQPEKEGQYLLSPYCRLRETQGFGYSCFQLPVSESDVSELSEKDLFCQLLMNTFILAEANYPQLAWLICHDVWGNPGANSTTTTWPMDRHRHHPSRDSHRTSGKGLFPSRQPRTALYNHNVCHRYPG